MFIKNFRNWKINENFEYSDTLESISDIVEVIEMEEVKDDLYIPSQEEIDENNGNFYFDFSLNHNLGQGEARIILEGKINRDKTEDSDINLMLDLGLINDEYVIENAVADIKYEYYQYNKEDRRVEGMMSCTIKNERPIITKFELSNFLHNCTNLDIDILRRDYSENGSRIFNVDFDPYY